MKFCLADGGQGEIKNNRIAWWVDNDLIAPSSTPAKLQLRGDQSNEFLLFFLEKKAAADVAG